MFMYIISLDCSPWNVPVICDEMSDPSDRVHPAMINHIVDIETIGLVA